MLRGHLDAVTSSGFVQGWAYDARTPARPLALSVRTEGAEVARGLANIYRADLVDAGCGTGWCAFRFRSKMPVGRMRRSPTSLHLLSSGEEIFSVPKLALLEDNDLPLQRVEEIAGTDPTLIDSIEQLRGCGEIFDTLIDCSGLEAFIRAAYNYALGRAADPSGIETYTRMIGSEELTPYGLLYALCDSDEFRAVPRLLIAPTEPGFIFNAL